MSYTSGSSNIDFTTEENYIQEDATNGTDFMSGKVTLNQVSGSMTWTARTLPDNSDWKSIIYADGKFVAVSRGGTIATSTDGITWNKRTAPSADWQSVTYGNGTFVAVANSSKIAATSPDGITWIQRTLPTSGRWSAVSYGNGTFVAVVASSTIAVTSPDGITWTQRIIDRGDWSDLSFGCNKFVAIAYTGNVAATSSDGISWTLRNLPASGFWSSITYGDGLFVATYYGSTIAATSPDGITWTQRTVPTNNLLSVTYGNGLYVAVPYGGSIGATSSDGLTWDQTTLPASLNWEDVAYGNNSFTAISFSESDKAATSSSSLSYPATPYYITTSDSSQVSTSTWSHLTGVNITQTTPDSTDIKYLVSFDDRSTWKYWDGDSWESSSLDNLQTNGMAKSTLEGLSQSNWETTGGFDPGTTQTIDIAADLSSSSNSVTPELDDIQFNYSLDSYPTSTQTLTSSVYNTTFAASNISRIRWTESLPSNTDIKFQIRTSADGTNWGSWCGPDNEVEGTCSSATYFTDSEGTETIDDTQRDRENDQYFQYKVYLSSSDGADTPTLSDVIVTYTDAAPPSISGFDDGGLYFDNVTPVTENGDATLNGNSFTSGTAVTEEGEYTVTVDNGEQSVSKSFTILKNKTVYDPDSTKMNEDYTLGIIDTGGAAASTADEATIKVNYTLISNSSSLYIPRNTVITSSEEGTIDVTKLTTLDISQSINNENSNSKGAIKIGIPNQNLTFSQPVTVTMDVQSSYNGKILTVYSKPDEGGSWTYETTCLVADSKCTFNTTHATEYTGNYEVSNSPTPTDVNVAIDATISLTCTDSITMGTITGTGQSNLTTNEALCTVGTINSSGYQLSWLASTAYMENENGDQITAYTPTTPNTPETWSVASTESEWGGRVKSTSTDPDLTGEAIWDALDSYSGTWLNVSTSPFVIANRTTETAQQGSTETILFGAEIGSNKFQPTGTYDVDVTFTATTL